MASHGNSIQGFLPHYYSQKVYLSVRHSDKPELIQPISFLGMPLPANDRMGSSKRYLKTYLQIQLPT